MLEVQIPHQIRSPEWKSEGPLILAIVHNEVDWEMEGKLLFIEPDAEPLAIPMPLVANLFFFEGRLAEYRAKPSFPQMILDSTEELYANAKADLEDAVGSDAYSKIFACKRMTFLVNSNGGRAETGKALENLAGVVRKNGGKVKGFIGSFAESAAAQLLASMDERTSLPDSRLLWHVSHVEGGGISQDLRMEETAEIEQFFEQNVKNGIDTVRRKVRAAIDDPNNLDNKVIFTGSELEDYGVVETVRDPDALRVAVLTEVPESLTTGLAGSMRRAPKRG